MSWITLQQASNISGKSERTIRHYITQLRKKHADKFEGSYYKYDLQDNGKYTLVVKRSFIVGKESDSTSSKSNVKAGKVVSQTQQSKVLSQPSVNEIEALTERRIRLLRESHKEEISRLKEEVKRVEDRHVKELDRQEDSHQKLLDTLDVAAVRMIEQHNGTTEMSKGQVNRLEQQLIAKDEIMKQLLEDMRALRLERSDVVSNYIEVSDKPTDEQKEEALRDLEEIEEVDNQEEIEDLETKIDKAIDSDLSFADWLSR